MYILLVVILSASARILKQEEKAVQIWKMPENEEWEGETENLKAKQSQ